MAAEKLSAKQAAIEIGTDARTLRKFLRSDDCPLDPVGQGNRYEFTKGEVKQLKKLFLAWSPGSKKQKKVIEEDPAIEEEVIEEIDLEDDEPEEAYEEADDDEEPFEEEEGDEDEEDDEPSDDELEEIEDEEIEDVEICDHCGRDFATLKGLKQHIRKVHSALD